MRIRDFILDLRERFPLQSDEATLDVFADAMTQAQHRGVHEFVYNGTTYTMRSVWKDGCINGDCNPATCYTDWELTSGESTPRDS